MTAWTPSPAQHEALGLAMAESLARWEAREPGARVELVTGSVVIDGYSPCFRRVFYHPFGADPVNTATVAWRTTFRELVKP